MKREEIEKLLGGYATGTLTPEEREALFAAAIEDQQLFDALAREEPLRELLQDPIAKTRLLGGLQRMPAPWYRRWLRPAAWAIPVAAMAALVVTLIVERQVSQQPVNIADVRQLRRDQPVAPVPSPVPQILEKRALPQLPRLLKDQPEPAAAPAAAPLAAIPPPPPPATPVAPPAPEQVRVATAFGVTPQEQGAIGLQPVAGLVRNATPDARSLFFGAPGPVFQLNAVDSQKRRVARPAASQLAAAAVSPMTHLGIRYRLLKKLADGESAAVNPNELLGSTDDLVLRLEANEPGNISVFERRPGAGWQPLDSRATERLAAWDTPLGNSPELFVVFTRQAQAAPYPVPETPLDQAQSFYPTEQVTYVVSTQMPAPQLLAFPITLKRK